MWLRLALPFALDHVNIYLIEDGDGWAVLDTGVADLRSRTVWESVFARFPVSRVIVTHFHPDHAGLAGWMTERFGVELAMSQTEYLFAQNLRHNPQAWGTDLHLRFYRRGGLDAETADALVNRGHGYLKLTTELPPSYRRLVAGERLQIGGRQFEIMTGGGHAPEQVMLLCREAGLFLAADQVLARISPNIAVWPGEPEGNPLGVYLASLAALRDLPDNLLVLPAHNLPFYGLHARIGELERHHASRLHDIVGAAAEPRSVADLLPVLFPRALDPQQMSFAFGEVLAHVNDLLNAGKLIRETAADGVQRVRRP